MRSSSRWATASACACASVRRFCALVASTSELIAAMPIAITPIAAMTSMKETPRRGLTLAAATESRRPTG